MGRRDGLAHCDSHSADHRAVVHNGDDPTAQVRSHSHSGPSRSTAPASTGDGADSDSKHSIQAPESYLHDRKSNGASFHSEDDLARKRSKRAGLGRRGGRRSWRGVGGTTRWFTRRSYRRHGDFRTDPTSTAARSEASCSRWFAHQGSATNLCSSTGVSASCEASARFGHRGNQRGARRARKCCGSACSERAPVADTRGIEGCIAVEV
jgi:hypothetical protein